MDKFYVGNIEVWYGKDSVSSIESIFAEHPVNKVMIITDVGIKKAGLLNSINNTLAKMGVSYFVHTNITPNPKVEEIREGVLLAKKEKADFIVALGGGSVMDSSKVISAMINNEGDILEYGRRAKNRRNFSENSIPLLSIPTTAGTGSEINTYAVITNEEGKKITIESPSIMGNYVILDPTLTLSLPKRVTAETGIDALSHCFGAILSPSMLETPNLVAESNCIEAIVLILENIREAYFGQENYQARENMLWASFMAGIALTMGTVGATHGLGNSITQFLHRSHGASLAMVFPYELKLTSAVTKEKFVKIAKRLDPSIEVDEAVAYIVQEIQSIIRDLEFETLSEAAENPDILDKLADEAAINSGCYNNILKFDRELAMSVYESAYANMDIEDFNLVRV